MCKIRIFFDSLFFQREKKSLKLKDDKIRKLEEQVRQAHNSNETKKVKDFVVFCFVFVYRGERTGK